MTSDRYRSFRGGKAPRSHPVEPVSVEEFAQTTSDRYRNFRGA